ncbi:MAG: hypothetical protein IT260_14585 [Saprospiraceae bacterium]|nr:hypothetical protein [Saprospiraceae bacterium]
MDPVLIEVRCLLNEAATEWEYISNISLQIGYPGRGGNTLWKHIGWLRDRLLPSGNAFAQAEWSKEMVNHVLVFDFLPVVPPNQFEAERSYRIRKNVTDANGRTRRRRSGILEGDYSDEHITLHAIYPEPLHP